MTIREKFKGLKGRVKEGAPRIFGRGSSPAQSASSRSIPNAQVASPSISHVPDTLAALDAPDPAPTPTPMSIPPAGDQAASAGPFSPASIGSTVELQSPSTSPTAHAVTLLNLGQASAPPYISPTGTQPALASGGSAVPTSPLPNIQIIPPGGIPVPCSSALPDAIHSVPKPISLAIPTTSDVISSTPASAIEGFTKPSNDRIIEKGWKSLSGFIEVLNKGSNVFLPLKLVMGELVQCVDMYEDTMQARQGYAALKNNLEGLLSSLSSHFSGDVTPTMTASIDNLCSIIEKELDRISTKEERQTWKRHYEAKNDLDDVMECYRRVYGYLERLNINANLSIWKLVDKQTTEAQLKSLTPSTSACYNSAEAALVRRRECTPNTREQVLSDLGIWRHDKKQGNLYWLNGMAGTGKTTIASSLCAMLNRSHELGASFFCTRLLPECRNVNVILPTIAYQLARFSHPFRRALCRALERDPDIHTKALPKQLVGMIVSPLREVANTLPANLVVVIDALDECDDSHGVGLLLELLVGHASELPIKVFVASRPEPQIRQKIGGMKSKLVLHELEHSIVKEDIRTYLQVELESMSLLEPQLAALVERAGILFIYAATVVRYIGAGGFSLNPQKRLAVVMNASTSASSNQNREIDALYGTILESAFNDPELEDGDREQMKLVLDTVICAQEPLTLAAFAGLLRLNDTDQVHTALRPLWSVLHISGANGLVTTLHASFPDYMLDPKRSQQHTCAVESHNRRLAELCFERIRKNQCQFNVCGLQSSYILDKQVADLKERVERAIPLDLAYACQYWAVHLGLGGQSNQLLELLDEFLSNRLLLWMEVLNLTKRMHSGAKSLNKARQWCNEGNSAQKTKDLVDDAGRFVTIFAANAVSKSTPHIYSSMLPSWPRSVPVAGCYIKRTKGLVGVKGTGMVKRQLELLSVLVVGSQVNLVALSPDGMRIVSGSDDNILRVWDVQTGQQVLAPFEGHNSSVRSVAFSSDGMRIVSGSNDKTIRVWDVQSGQQLLAPLKGHTSSVNSVAFSPDGMRIVSGSDDMTIRVWDAQSGLPVFDNPLKKHTDSVNSVSFSPDGKRIVSGSNDNTIRMWDAQSGQHVFKNPLKGHTSWVNSVAFSPDGKHIVSGSYDDTICIWNVQNGERVLGPLIGHTSSVNSVTFSPDGMRIASGSNDKTIYIWDVRNGMQVLGPLEGHTALVKSVAFSPDGKRIVSGSHDKTIRLWDVQSGQQQLAPLKGHTSTVNSVAFSPDGMRIASGSYDNTIYVWDVRSEQTMLAELRGHDSSVRSVAFSHDSKRIVSGSSDNTIRVWDEQSGLHVLKRLLQRCTSYDQSGPHVSKRLLVGHTSSVNSAAFSPDGMHIVSGSKDNTIRLWDVQSGQQVLVPLQGHTDSVNLVAFSPDGMRVVSGSDDMTIRVWDAQSGQQVLAIQGHTSAVRSAAFSPDGRRIVSGSDSNTIRVWNAQSGQRVIALKGHTSSVRSVAFSPDSMHIVSSSNDKTIRLWDVQNGQRVLVLKGHVSTVNSVAFSPDGMRVVSGSHDKTIRVWDVQTGHRTPDAVIAFDPKLLPSPDAYCPPESITAGPTCNVSSSYVLHRDGWVINEHKHLLFWVPPDLRDRLLINRTIMLISTQGSVYLDFKDAKHGESWVECYTPAL